MSQEGNSTLKFAQPETVGTLNLSVNSEIIKSNEYIRRQ